MAMSDNEALKWLKAWSATHQNENDNIRESVWLAIKALEERTMFNEIMHELSEYRAKVIDEFAERLQTKIISEIDDCADELEWISEIAEQMKGEQNEGLQ
jgi:hypothetical protein